MTFSKLIWTKHSQNKMRFYGLSENRVKRVLRNPQRTEEGVAKNTIAVMQPSSTKKKEGKTTWTKEIWVMFQKSGAKLKIISAWRYPGISPKRNPIPNEIIRELKDEGLI